MVLDNEKYSPRIITFTGASGSGKSSIVRELLKDPEFTIVLSVTTRKPRREDLYGEYVYVSEDEFFSFERRNDFLWHTNAHGNKYGTLRHSVDSALESKKKSMMVLVPQVVPILHSYAPKGSVLPFYVKLLDEKILTERLRSRGDSEETIERRINDCKNWHDDAQKSSVPYRWVYNEGTIEDAAAQVRSYIEHLS